MLMVAMSMIPMSMLATLSPVENHELLVLWLPVKHRHRCNEEGSRTDSQVPRRPL
jgi:hypothetical protein